jgi:hypothetical protein
MITIRGARGNVEFRDSAAGIQATLTLLVLNTDEARRPVNPPTRRRSIGTC